MFDARSYKPLDALTKATDNMSAMLIGCPEMDIMPAMVS